MHRYWFRSMLALLVTAALLTSVGTLAEGAVRVEAIDSDEVYCEQEFTIGGESLPEEEARAGEAEIDLPGKSALSISPSSVTIAPGAKASVVLTVPYTNYSLDCVSSDESVADWELDMESWGADSGVPIFIYGYSVGKAVITFTTDRGDSATLRVTVKKPEREPRTISVSTTSLTMKAGKSVDVTLTKSGRGDISWSSSKKSVATVDWDGGWDGKKTVLHIYGVSAGTATVTVKNKKNREKVQIKVTVKKGEYPQKGKRDGKTIYRALLVGEEHYTNLRTCTSNRADVVRLNNMLTSRKGGNGGAWSIDCRYDLNNADVKRAIRSSFKKADEDDVSLFFIATHGDDKGTGGIAGALAMSPVGFMTMGELANALKAVPGKVTVLIEACGSGAGVYSIYDEQNGADVNAVKSAVKAFDHAVVDAFAAVDEGVVARGSAGAAADAPDAPNTGELRMTNKFYVLTSSRYQESSWGTEQSPYYNYFTKWLSEGVGTGGAMRADTDNNDLLTLNELFKYISQVGDSHGFGVGGHYYYQHVQAYPKNSGFVLFHR